MLCWGINNAWARGPSIVEVPEYIDSEQGRPFLFFLSQGEIVARECDPSRIASSEDSCKALSGSGDFRVEQSRFVDILKSLILLEEGNYTPPMQEKIKLYNVAQGRENRRVVGEIAKLRENKSIVTSPGDILSLIDDLLKGEPLCSAQNRLPPTGTHASRLDVQKTRSAVGEVDKRIRHMVEGISSAGLLMYVSPKRENRNFSYNLLSSYLSVFQKI